MSLSSSSIVSSFVIREVQIKTKKDSATHLSESLKLKKNSVNSKYWRGGKEIQSFIHCFQEC